MSSVTTFILISLVVPLFGIVLGQNTEYGCFNNEDGKCERERMLRAENMFNLLTAKFNALASHNAQQDNVIANLRFEVADLTRHNVEQDNAIAHLRSKVAHLTRHNVEQDNAIAHLRSEVAPLASHNAEQDNVIANLLAQDAYGVLVWKINNYATRKENEIRGVVAEQSSEPFFTSRYGYKLMVEADLNGHGIGVGTHLSVFVFIMKGEYDEILQWPFQNNITFTLLNVNHNTSVIEEVLTPRPDFDTFQKPVSDRNIGRGYSSFAEQSVVEANYIFNDTIYLKISVH